MTNIVQQTPLPALEANNPLLTEYFGTSSVCFDYGFVMFCVFLLWLCVVWYVFVVILLVLKLFLYFPVLCWLYSMFSCDFVFWSLFFGSDWVSRTNVPSSLAS